MTATGHALVATFIAAKFQNPALSLPLAFASHFLLDLVPHWDAGTHWREKTQRRLLNESAIDVAVGFVISLLLYTFVFNFTNYLYLFIVIIVAQLPDWLMGPYLVLKIDWPIFKYAYHLGRKTNKMLDKPWGIVTQIATVLATYLLLFKIF